MSDRARGIAPRAAHGEDAGDQCGARRDRHGDGDELADRGREGQRRSSRRRSRSRRSRRGASAPPRWRTAGRPAAPPEGTVEREQPQQRLDGRVVVADEQRDERGRPPRRAATRTRRVRRGRQRRPDRLDGVRGIRHPRIQHHPDGLRQPERGLGGDGAQRVQAGVVVAEHDPGRSPDPPTTSAISANCTCDAFSTAATPIRVLDSPVIAESANRRAHRATSPVPTATGGEGERPARSADGQHHDRGNDLRDTGGREDDAEFGRTVPRPAAVPARWRAGPGRCAVISAENVASIAGVEGPRPRGGRAASRRPRRSPRSGTPSRRPRGLPCPGPPRGRRRSAARERGRRGRVGPRAGSRTPRNRPGRASGSPADAAGRTRCSRSSSPPSPSSPRRPPSW